ncbi:MAG: hypothetical protein OEV42_06050 [Deltaproteobacteria bacterium]|nr:hypothetical protein [Deltaproteobacteria bacterium]
MKHPLEALPLALSIFSLFLVIPAGCGKKGAPLPPESLVPQAVASVKVKGARDSLFISWTMPQKNSDGSKPADLAGFKLYKKSGEECPKCPGEEYPIYVDIDLEAPGAALIEGRRVTFIDTDLKEDRYYSYKVAPYNKSGYRGAFSEAVNIKWQSPPPPPEGFKGSASDRTAVLKWQPFKAATKDETIEEDVIAYNIYRSNTSGDYPSSPITKSPVKGDSFTDIGLENNRQYYYTAKSVIITGDRIIESEPSGEIILIPIDTVPPAPPKRLTAVLADVGVRLFWEPQVTKDILGYNIYRRKKGDLAAGKINKSPVEGTTFSDYDVINSISYFYAITAVDNSLQKNESVPSEEISIKIPK